MSFPLVPSTTAISERAQEFAARRLSAPLPITTNNSPRRPENQFCARWGTREVTLGSSTNPTFVTVNFQDPLHQRIPLGQLVSLANAGVDTMKYSLGTRNVVFIFSQSEKAEAFADLVKSCISPNPNQELDYHSPASRLFTNWVIQTDAHNEPEGAVTPHIKVTFANEDRRKVIFRQLGELGTLGVSDLIIDLKHPTEATFEFDAVKLRDTFLTRMEKESQLLPETTTTGRSRSAPIRSRDNEDDHKGS